MLFCQKLFSVIPKVIFRWRFLVSISSIVDSTIPDPIPQLYIRQWRFIPVKTLYWIFFILQLFEARVVLSSESIDPLSISPSVTPWCSWPPATKFSRFFTPYRTANIVTSFLIGLFNEFARSVNLSISHSPRVPGAQQGSPACLQLFPTQAFLCFNAVTPLSQ